MNRDQKVELVEQLSERLQSTPLVVLTDYRGVDVAEINQFRRSLEANGIEYRVIKNTLGRLAVEGTDLEGLASHMTGMTGWVLSGEDPIAAAKVLRDITKDLNKNDKLLLKAGYFDGQTLDGAEVKKVADLPSREELLSLLLRTIQEGPRQVLGILQAPARDLLYLLKNYETKLEEAEGAE
jgi:large subunit ribosomal protein L10